ncbi:fibritin neck whisker [Pseudomonas phage PspYZU05]|uniref:Fibritin neck whisker protein n=1 Tax=Pseudomonas phage PspYZU05 TaxID=1983556 RepID=A0A2U7N8B8_9CAUD|nr:fibritin neck whisker [Pseudomonas phage PspYZU05]ASD52073.1 fibritin neck whisker protein [Pseudomonas phage PspYZU05]
MDKILLSPLPYVDGLPNEGQIRINWAKNGEDFTAASTINGNDGVLNRAGVSIQKNVVALQVNQVLVGDKVNELVDNVNTINNALNILDNEDIIAQVTINKTDISKIKLKQADIIQATSDLQLKVTEMDDSLGVYDPLEDSVYRTVRDDLFWIKKEMGQYPGQDINGQSVDGNDSTGMKRRIMSTSFVVNQQGERLTILEQKFHDSDVGSLTAEVESMRNELGNKSFSTPTPIYLRLRGMDTNLGTINQQLFTISESIGLTSGVSSLYQDVSSNTTRISILEDKSNDADTRLDLIEEAIGTNSIPTSINGRIKTNADSIISINGILGADTSSGLRGQVAWINQVVGIVPEGQPAPQDSILGELSVIQSSVGTLQNTVQDIQVEIGNNNEGIKGQILRLTNITFGTNPNGATVEERGLLDTVKSHDAKLFGISQAIGEAPKDGNFYVRKDGTWVLLSDALAALQP